ncbi:hypothetical protein ABFA07_021242 [Porites harrisoni]
MQPPFVKIPEDNRIFYKYSFWSLLHCVRVDNQLFLTKQGVTGRIINKLQAKGILQNETIATILGRF